jgi:hypothetical protein
VTTKELFTLLSLGLTPMTILANCAVISLWYTPFVRALSTREKTAVGWLIIGVVINFSGGVIDNIWWGIAWSYNYLNNTGEIKEFFFTNGVYSNTFFRQMTGIAGALCHIKSGITSESNWFKIVTFGGAFIGAVWVATLIHLTN